MKLPDFIVAGECKCATGSLYEYLVRHPNILPSYGNGYDAYLGNKEIRFFDRYWANGVEWYASRFPECLDGYITGEASPEYFARSLALRRISAIIPDVKIIISLRNPTDRAFSHYKHMKKFVKDWSGDYKSFEDFLNCTKEQDYYIIENGIYIKHLRDWVKVFGSNLKIVITEHLAEDPNEVCNDLYNFLGLEQHKIEEEVRLRTTSDEQMSPYTRKALEYFYQPYNEELYSFLECESIW